MSRYAFLPSVAIRGFNVFNSYDCDDCHDHLIDLNYLYLPRYQVFANTFIPHPFGNSLIGIGAQAFAPDYQINEDNTYVSYTYMLSRLSAHVAGSPFVYSFGFVFRGDSYGVGIRYTDEKQENEINIDRQRKTYITAKFTF